MENENQTTQLPPSPAAPCSAVLDSLARHPKTIAHELESAREDDEAWLMVVPHKYAMAVAKERDEIITQLRKSLTAMYLTECPEDVPNYWSANSGWKRAIQDTLKLLPNAEAIRSADKPTPTKDQCLPRKN